MWCKGLLHIHVLKGSTCINHVVDVTLDVVPKHGDFGPQLTLFRILMGIVFMIVRTLLTEGF